jgi:murein DD-endopeptidase MepM/ murein hydrolase activator NlpD
MSSNKFFTIMIVPEKTQNVRRIIIPNYVFRGGILIGAFLFVLATVMVLDYANVMHQISENKQLKAENRQLKQEVQVFKDKILTMDNTLDRVKTFATKLRIITNVEDRSAPLSAPLLPGPASQPPGANPFGIPGFGGKNSSASPLQNTTTSAVDTDEEAEQDNASSAAKIPVTLRSILSTSIDSTVLMEGDTSIFVRTEFEKLNTAYGQLAERVNAQEKEIQEIYEQLSDKKSMLASMPTMTPTDGYITSGFGIRYSPYGGKRKMHEGIDIANRYGADVVAPGDGVVIMAGIKPGYGKIICIDHGYGLKSYYGHTASFYVTKGQKVKRGQRIAAVGSTGRSTGPHLHYEIHANDTPIDPMYYLLDR